ncbi:PLP-dependent transferase [Hesseltinella vesiculosa]|uniref:PLP-dependent transferase n=1 Tax=Hesseltinella vesiculosa TaxID=101127 RepID=A0A1X2GHD9_9FUNG|nr:PLP-dependent transferase [Hesseltinella vesiculosa]
MVINFLKGQPSQDLLPIDLFRKATALAIAEPDGPLLMLQYGHELGSQTFRANLASFLSYEYREPVQPAHLCATAGASLGVEHIVGMLTQPRGKTKFAYFQDPTYFLVFAIFKDLGFQPHQFIGVPDKPCHGLDVDHFERALAQHFPVPPTPSDDGLFDSVLYCVPTHANPTGSTLNNHDRQRLVQLAKKYNVLVISDDVYDILTYEPEHMPRRLVAFDLDTNDDHPVVISNGTFSKILAPGIRCGWYECHPRLIRALGER